MLKRVRAEWRSVEQRPGTPFVMACGAMKRELSSAKALDTHDTVSSQILNTYALIIYQEDIILYENLTSSMQIHLLLLVPASARALDQSLPPTLSVMERRIVSLTVHTQQTQLPVPMLEMLESIVMKHVSRGVVTATIFQMQGNGFRLYVLNSKW